MSRRVGDLLRQRAREGFVGRKDEVAALLRTLEEKVPLIKITSIEQSIRL